MTAAEILARLRAAGFTLVAHGNSFQVTPASRLCSTDRRDLKKHKADLLELLRLEEFCRVLEVEYGQPRGPVYFWQPTGSRMKCGKRPRRSWLGDG